MSFSAAKAAPESIQRAKGKGQNPERRHFAFCTFLFAFCLTLLVSSAEAQILIEPHIGFRGVFQLGQPFPLEVELNNGGRPAEGVLQVQVWKGGATKGGAPFLVNYRRDVFLPAQARKTVQFTVDPDFISRPMTITFTSPSGRATREVDLRRHFAPGPVLLVLSEGHLLAPLTDAPQSRLVTLAPGELPADPRALLGVSHMILYDQSLRDLSRAQFSALDTWITAGGRLIIIGSLNFALYQEALLSRLLPVRVTGTRRVDFTPEAGKGKRHSTKLSGVLAQEVKLLNGKVLADIDGVPILVETSRGRGRVTYFALDIGRPPLSHWDGLQAYLQTLLTPAVFADAAARTEWNDAVFAQLVASPTFISTYVPFAALFFAMLIYLAGIALIPWIGQRLRLTLRVLLVGLIVFVGAATIIGYLQFNRGGNIPDGVLMTSTVLESSGDGYVEAQANLALFSTQPRPYDLRMESGWMELTPVSSRVREASEPAVVDQEGGGASRFHLPLREWDYRLFRMRRVDRFPLHLEFETQNNKLSMKINNQSGKDLINCWLLIPGQRFELGPIARGASWTKSFPLTRPEGRAETDLTRTSGVSFRDLSFADKTKDILFHSSFFPRDGEARWANGAAVFFAWVKQPEPRVRVNDPRIQTQDFALFRAIVPLGGGEEE
jgi:hypothetical protein